MLERYQRRTTRLADLIGAVVTELAGRGSVRVLTAMAAPLSRHTAIRLLRRLPVASHQIPRVLGVDDFALRKRRRYAAVCQVSVVPRRNANGARAKSGRSRLIPIRPTVVRPYAD